VGGERSQAGRLILAGAWSGSSTGGGRGGVVEWIGWRACVEEVEDELGKRLHVVV
jgi:hypothetical protein